MTPARVTAAALKARRRSSSNHRNLQKRHKRMKLRAKLATKEFSADEKMVGNAANLEDIR
jgi:hypothetical protein